MKYIKILLLSFFVISSYSYAQETEVEAPTNLDKLLELVKEGKSKEQGENRQREAEFTGEPAAKVTTGKIEFDKETGF